MKTEKRIPFGISEYIKDHFREDFLFHVKEVKEVNGHPVYVVEVTKDDYVHTLRFNEEGTLLKEDAEQVFPPDIHEEQTLRDIPE
jgi:hypothetical protein